MKTVTIFSILIASLAAVPVQAGGRHHHGYYSGHHSHHWRGHRNRHDFGRHHYRRHRRHHNHDGAYLLGGILIGSLLTHSNDRYSYRERHYYYPGRTVYRNTAVDGPVIDPESTASGTQAGVEEVVEHILLQDRDGNCFVVTEKDDGTELRRQIDSGACDVE
ncbi:MAG: hypothetical protein P8Y42_16995 [Exilibacterium sp.]